MITASACKGKHIGVFGLARTGIAAARALEASGATVLAWDDAEAKRESVGALAKDLYEADFNALDALMLAPGIPLTHPAPHALVVKATQAGTPIICDFDIFEAARAEMPAHKVVAITGTNGKSTTTALIGHMVAACGKPAAIGGNIGTGVLSLNPLPEDGVYVFELSSFQLDLTKAFAADIAVLLNITPDHLDRHGDLAGYVRAKKRLFDLQAAGGVAVISIDDSHGAVIAAGIEGKVIRISVETIVPGGIYVQDGTLIDDLDGAAVAIGHISDEVPALQGSHNWQNAAAAYAAGRSLGFTAAAIFEAFRSFPGLAHRQETLAVIDGIRIVNDSKATNIDAASRALKAFSNIHWIAGGRPKEKNFSALLPFMCNVKHSYLIGEAADAIAHDMEGAVPLMDCRDLAHALELAFENAVSGDVILLSPACTAFDQFRDFEARGEAFRVLVAGLEGERT